MTESACLDRRSHEFLRVPSRHCQVKQLGKTTPKMVGSSPVANRACWGSASPILLDLTLPVQHF